MEITLSYLHLLIFLLISILSHFIVSYVSHMGQDQATKKSIAHITEVVESIKSAKQIESSNILSNFQDRRRVLLNYFEALTLFVDDHTNIEFEITNDLDALIKLKPQISGAYNKLVMRKKEIELFIDDKQLQVFLMKLGVYAGDHESCTILLINQCKHNLKRIDILKTSSQTDSNRKISDIYSRQLREWTNYLDHRHKNQRNSIGLNRDFRAYVNKLLS